MSKRRNKRETQRQLESRYTSSTVVPKDDQRKSVKAVHHRVDKIMHHVRQQDNGHIYGNELRNAGSHSTKTKIGKADEFDFNIPLNIKGKDFQVKTKGKINYKYDDPPKVFFTNNFYLKLLNQLNFCLVYIFYILCSKIYVQGGANPANLNVQRSVTKKSQSIPTGYAAVKIRDDAAKEKFKHIQNDGYIDPRKVKEDLHGKMKQAIQDLHLNGMQLAN